MSENVTAEKSKSQLRAERRAVQESQRAAKAATKGPSKASSGQQQQQRSNDAKTSQQPQQVQKAQQPLSQHIRTKTLSTGSDAARSRSRDKGRSGTSGSLQSNAQQITESTVVGSASDGLQTTTVRRGSREESSGLFIGKAAAEIHPAFSQLALRIPGGAIVGSDAQCLAVIDAFKQLALDYQSLDGKAYSREFENAIKPCISRIANNRALPPATASLVKQLKLHLSTISNETSENEARDAIIDWLDDFADRHIVLSTQAIAEAVTSKLKKMDRGGNHQLVIMIYLFSATVQKTLMEAHRQGVSFEVVVVDSVPKKEGYITIRRLSSMGIKCRYVLLTGVSAVLRNVNVVLLGAEGLLANGNVVAPLGSSTVAMTANARNVPVLVLCHTYKFCEKVFTVTLETGWPDTEVMPAEFVTGVVTELRTLPCSAVPAVLRVKQLGGGIS